jgi:hypothetical protein
MRKLKIIEHISLAPELKPRRCLEDALIVIGRAQEHKDPRILGDRDVSELHVDIGDTGCPRNRAIPAKGLLHGGGGEGRIAHERRELLGVQEQEA